MATAARVLANVAPVVLDRLLDAARVDGAPRRAATRPTPVAPRDEPPFADDESVAVPPVVRERLRRLAVPEGAQVKVNLLLTRLPRLRDADVAPEEAFAGTFHINELETQLEAAFPHGGARRHPVPLPCEIYCHTLSDPRSSAPELAASDAHTLTVFGLHVPDRLVERFGNDELRERLQAAVLASLDSVLAEPIADVIATDAAGRPCIEVKTTRDLEEALSMPGGNIFHGPLSWPWAEDDAPARDARRALGRGDRGTRGSCVRLGRRARRRGQRHRRAQRGDGGARGHLPPADLRATADAAAATARAVS